MLMSYDDEWGSSSTRIYPRAFKKSLSLTEIIVKRQVMKYTSRYWLRRVFLSSFLPQPSRVYVCVCVFPALLSVGGSAPSLLLSVFPQPLWWCVSSVCPSISHLLWIWRRLALKGPQKKLHTLQFDKNVSEHLSHLSELVVNTRSRLLPLRTQESV